VTGRLLKDLAISKENVYNTDDTGVMLLMLGTVKVLVGKDAERVDREASIQLAKSALLPSITLQGRKPSLLRTL
jgi:hypothetical protein